MKNQLQYRVFDSMGRRTEVVIFAENIKDACHKAKQMVGSEEWVDAKGHKIGVYYKIKRDYLQGYHISESK